MTMLTLINMMMMMMMMMMMIVMMMMMMMMMVFPRNSYILLQQNKIDPLQAYTQHQYVSCSDLIIYYYILTFSKELDLHCISHREIHVGDIVKDINFLVEKLCEKCTNLVH